MRKTMIAMFAVLAIGAEGAAGAGGFDWCSEKGWFEVVTGPIATDRHDCVRVTSDPNRVHNRPWHTFRNECEMPIVVHVCVDSPDADVDERCANPPVPKISFPLMPGMADIFAHNGGSVGDLTWWAVSCTATN